MKAIVCLAAALFCAVALGAETFFIATITDFVGEKSFRVVSKEECKELDKEIKQKNILLQRVLMEVQTEFRKNPEAHKGEKYLGSKLKPMTVKYSPPFPDEEKAREKMEKMQEHEDDKTIDASKKKKKLSDAEKLRAVKEAEREYAIKAFGEEVVKRIEAIVSAAAAEAGAQ